MVTSLSLVAGSDSGIKGDENTNTNQPVFLGQISASFPGTLGGLTVLAEFSGLHGEHAEPRPSTNGFGFQGTFDVSTTTDANGTFKLNAPFLPEGFEPSASW